MPEILPALLNGICVSVCLVIGTTQFFCDPSLTTYKQITVFGFLLAVVSCSVLQNASFMRTLLPLPLNKIKIDPVIATGPYISTINDVFSLLFYFSVILLVRRWL